MIVGFLDMVAGLMMMQMYSEKLLMKFVVCTSCALNRTFQTRSYEMGKRRRDSDSSELSDVPSHVSDAAQEPANANENAQDAMDAAPAEPPAPPAAPAEPPPKPSGGLQLKIKLTVNPGGAAAVEAASPAVPPPSDAPGTAELVKTRRRNRPSDFGVSATPEELAAALGMPSARPKGSDKRPAKRLKSDPELAALTPVKAEKGAADKGKTPGTGKADSKKGSPEARAVFLGLIEDLRAQTAAEWVSTIRWPPCSQN